MSKPYEARISTGILKTAFYRQSNESSNAVFGLSTDGNTNANSVTIKNNVPNASSITRSVNKTETRTSPLINTAIRDNIINTITGETNGDIEVLSTNFYTDNAATGDKPSLVFSGSQRPMQAKLDNSTEQNANNTHYIFNKSEYTNTNLEKIQRSSTGYSSSGILYPNTTDTCPRQSPYPDPGLTGITYIYDDQQGWIPYP